MENNIQKIKDEQLPEITKGCEEIQGVFKEWNAWKVYQDLQHPNRFIFVWFDDESGYRVCETFM